MKPLPEILEPDYGIYIYIPVNPMKDPMVFPMTSHQFHHWNPSRSIEAVQMLLVANAELDPGKGTTCLGSW